MRFTDRVALVTGAARGQGRAHALALAAEGADLILIDAVAPIETVEYDLPDPDELELVAKEVEGLGRRAFARTADVRDLVALEQAVTAGVEELGRLDIIVANAGILSPPRLSWEMSELEWTTMLDVNLSGVWRTTRAGIPHMLAGGRGGSVILISSIAGLRGIPNVSNYVAAKHGLVGLAGSLANELAEHQIRVNSIHPTNVRTPMIDNPTSARIFRPDLEAPTLQDGVDALRNINLLAIPWVETEDITAAVMWLASDESCYVTGAAIPVDAGMLAKYHA
jgi:SDR family mycofactocin-dependent oxidoreductase